MQSNNRTLKDLSFIGQVTEGNILNLIDRCTTYIGSKLLQKQLTKSPSSYSDLVAQQAVVQFWHQHPDQWPKQISNGTVVMVEKFYESADAYSGHAPSIQPFGGKFFQKLFNRNEYHFTQFSLSHLSDFLKGCTAFVALLDSEEALPELLKDTLLLMQQALAHRLSKDLIELEQHTPFKEIVRLSFHARREMKATIHELTEHFGKLDLWYGMALATKENDWQFPQLLPAHQICLHAEGLYHPLLKHPVRYEINFGAAHNFMILTGANMSGKTTLMRSVGIAAILAHLGMGIPAKSMHISYLASVISNMHVEDDLLKGDSFFLAEVKNIKQTAIAAAHTAPQLILMDELFKGTNVHDAYECTKAIVDGLLRHPQHIMILSTHLHEVARYFEQNKQLNFYCFHTLLSNEGNFEFNYQLAKGISDERIGYKILVKEGVIDILNGEQNS
jgi:DNA mismatch repair protein MutS